MGHWVGVYTDELPKLKSVIGSNSPAHFDQVLKACGGKFGHDPETHDRIAAALRNLIAGTYSSGEREDGAYYIYAFEHICRTFARKWTVEEIYVADESFPEMVGFVWGSVEDAADAHLLDDDPFGLPEGEYGPVCYHRDLKIVKQEIKHLSNLDYEQIAELDADYQGEVAAILDVLKEAERTGQGVFITFVE